MTLLILGLILFLGTHSIRMLAPGWRERMIGSLGEIPWKGLYSLVALVGFILIVIGYGQIRFTQTWLWVPPTWTHHITALLMIPAFILLVAAYVPGTVMKAKLGHPMVLAVKTWAFAHLISNGTVADLVLFGGFLVWAIANFAISRRRDRATGVTYPAIGAGRDVVAIVIGLVAYGLFAFYLHALLIGIKPFG